MKLNKQEIDTLEFKFKINLINSITGIKPGNLIGTVDKEGNENLAIFSSVFHLGSNPPLIAFVTRPSQEVPRHTLQNILETSSYTVNHVVTDKIVNAHLTSAKFDKGISEFDACNLTPEYHPEINAPFVKESKIQIGMTLEDIMDVKANKTKIVIGRVNFLHIKEEKIVDDQGNINLSEAQSAGISGLRSYYSFQNLATLPIAHTDNIVVSEK
ncbi:flavin reductase family protein [Flammeovirga sp. EKP202]|uniref:flavin reductase family protein n=1 Tax=Flammeovirga sp. EKP202 TaxID=2770592 RepID=UPI00165F064E|nr:flavin reductase [Flammeovirga sp. EKP202]MBD0404048.1 flavin reductase [Flammeovirga sp. EKP202]